MKYFLVSLALLFSFAGLLFSQDDNSFTYTTAPIEPTNNNLIVILEDGTLRWINGSPPTITGPSAPDFPFTTDGCSLFPDGDWVHCCTIHDKAYWMGGSHEDRLKADFNLKECVVINGDQMERPILGWFIYFGVRIGGVSWIPTPFRWGYGWKFPRTGP